ncbi:hypothetical protein AB0D33_11495 [Streptomyces sp. NPDC048404]
MLRPFYGEGGTDTPCPYGAGGCSPSTATTAGSWTPAHPSAYDALAAC